MGNDSYDSSGYDDIDVSDSFDDTSSDSTDADNNVDFTQEPQIEASDIEISDGSIIEEGDFELSEGQPMAVDGAAIAPFVIDETFSLDETNPEKSDVTTEAPYVMDETPSIGDTYPEAGDITIEDPYLLDGRPSIGVSYPEMDDSTTETPFMINETPSIGDTYTVIGDIATEAPSVIDTTPPMNDVHPEISGVTTEAPLVIYEIPSLVDIQPEMNSEAAVDLPIIEPIQGIQENAIDLSDSEIQGSQNELGLDAYASSTPSDHDESNIYISELSPIEPLNFEQNADNEESIVTSSATKEIEIPEIEAIAVLSNQDDSTDENVYSPSVQSDMILVANNPEQNIADHNEENTNPVIMSDDLYNNVLQAEGLYGQEKIVEQNGFPDNPVIELTQDDSTEVQSEKDINDIDIIEVATQSLEGLQPIVNDSTMSILPDAEILPNDTETNEKIEDPVIVDESPFFSQGQNDLHFEGTCGLASGAHSLNALFDTNEFNENDMVTLAVENELCDLNENPELAGGTTTSQMMEIFDKVKEQNPDLQVQTELFEFDDALSIEEMAEKLDEGNVIQVAVDSAALWDQDHVYEGNGLLYSPTIISDHWISITGVDKTDGKINGFEVIDSGGGISYLNADKLQEVCFGNEDRKVIDPTSIVISKKIAA